MHTFNSMGVTHRGRQVVHTHTYIHTHMHAYKLFHMCADMPYHQDVCHVHTYIHTYKANMLTCVQLSTNGSDMPYHGDVATFALLP